MEKANLYNLKIWNLVPFLVALILGLMMALAETNYSEAQFNDTKIVPSGKSKDLTSEQNVLIKIVPGHGRGTANLSPKNVKVAAGTTVVWQNQVQDKVFLQSLADSNHYEGQVINASFIHPGEKHEQKLNEPGTFIYSGNDGFGSYYVRGYIKVVNASALQEKNTQNQIIQNQGIDYDINKVQWRNFTNDLGQFSVEYPAGWKIKIGNRFTGGTPLTAQHLSTNSNLAPSWIQIKILDSNGRSAQELTWAQKKVLVDRVKSSKLIEPVTCDKYKIDGARACSFVYASNDISGKRMGNLVVLINDNASNTHLIKYKSDAAVYDAEEPIINHLLLSYKLMKNHPDVALANFTISNSTQFNMSSAFNSTVNGIARSLFEVKPEAHTDLAMPFTNSSNQSSSQLAYPNVTKSQITKSQDILNDTTDKLLTKQKEIHGIRVLSENTFQDSDGDIHVAGEVQNILSSDIHLLRINVAYFDPDGKILGTDFGFAHPDDVQSNQTGTFEIITSKDSLAPGQFSTAKISYER